MMLLENPRALRDQYAKALLEDVIPFWLRHSPDRECGGYFTCLERDGRVFDTDKFVWLQARQVWMFSKFYNALEPRPEFLEIAALGARFLADHGHDANGDFYFALDRRGTPLVQPYNIFSDCFAAMAFAEFGRASGEEWATQLATRTFERILARWENPKGQYNKLVPGSRPMRSMVLPMITINLALELGGALPDYPVADVIRENLARVMDDFVDPDTHLIYEHIAPDGSHPDTFDGRLINPGHGIEAMWFVMDAAHQLGEHTLVERAADALEAQLQFGWDPEYEGIFYFMDALGKPPQQLEWDQKLWWVHMETLVGLLLGWHLTRRQSLAEWYDRVHAYAWSHFPDPEYGEWWGYLNRRGEVLLNLKGGKWKGCFHVPRGLFRCRQILDEVVASQEAGNA
ncbi:MAG TPA: AGE family epimerase/isomerase [Armatimonadota bacterium]|nr:AGE family epimerase/isomerase [Armatimonadota bacterium]